MPGSRSDARLVTVRADELSVASDPTAVDEDAVRESSTVARLKIFPCTPLKASKEREREHPSADLSLNAAEA